MVAIGNFLFRWRNTIFPWLFVLLLLPGPRLFANPWHALVLSVLVTGLGQTIRALTIGLRYIKRGGRGGKVYANDLVTEGIYGHVRNPMYVGNVLICLGVAIASNERIVTALAVPLAAFAYAAIVAAEEHYLRGKFGPAYEAYCRDVPAWIPNLRGLGDTLSGMTFNWRRVVLKEFGTPWGWISAIGALTLLNLWRSSSFETNMPLVGTILAVMAIATALWALVMTLKSRRILQLRPETTSRVGEGPRA
jgi:protein-S-isoprenylcysteine O-methyltransferase Ste14